MVHDRVTENARVLDVGSGSGLSVMLCAMLDQHDSYAAGSIRARGRDRRPGLSDKNPSSPASAYRRSRHFSKNVKRTVSKASKDRNHWYSSRRWSRRLSSLRPYDVIHVGAASRSNRLSNNCQRRSFGLSCWTRMAITSRLDELNGRFDRRHGSDVRPLTSAKEQTDGSKVVRRPKYG